jgi:GTP:adenosylcobinamide-phosphate guanylyltransferase
VQERYVVMNRKEIALNVNTKEEWELAEKLLVQRA